MRRSAEFGAALGGDLLGAAGALLAATQTWQVVRLHQPRPLPDEVLSVSGRTVDAAITALAVVALAGVVALLATRGFARRVVGVVVFLAGAAMLWRAVTAFGALNAQRARALVLAHHPGAPIGIRAPEVSTSATWPVVTSICAVLILVAGVLVAWRGSGWATLSARYDRPSDDGGDPDPAGENARAAATMWNDLDRGHDPTSAPRDEAGPDTTR
jgi:uncharacterized membrane protein (TIGR02234 family)